MRVIDLLFAFQLVTTISMIAQSNQIESNRIAFAFGRRMPRAITRQYFIANAGIACDMSRGVEEL
jgi:hypothetical protein